MTARSMPLCDSDVPCSPQVSRRCPGDSTVVMSSSCMRRTRPWWPAVWSPTTRPNWPRCWAGPPRTCPPRCVAQPYTPTTSSRCSSCGVEPEAHLDHAVVAGACFLVVVEVEVVVVDDQPVEQPQTPVAVVVELLADQD